MIKRKRCPASGQRRLPFFCLALVSAFLILLAAGCGIQRTPGGVMRPGAETLGYTVFRLDWQPVGVDKRQDTALKQARDRRDPNQFALWIENDRREYIRTLAVTEEAARQAWDGYSTGLNRWFINAGFLGRQQWKDINAAIVPVPADTRLQYTWYGDSFNGSEALPAGTYRYCVEACYGKEPSAYYEGVFMVLDSRFISWTRKSRFFPTGPPFSVSPVSRSPSRPSCPDKCLLLKGRI